MNPLILEMLKHQQEYAKIYKQCDYDIKLKKSREEKRRYKEKLKSLSLIC